MTLTYKFKKEKLPNGQYATRPRILVELSGSDSSIIIPALIDTGCDTTVIPEGIARAIGLDLNGEKHKIYGYRESTDVKQSAVGITFLGREQRESVRLQNVPALIALKEDNVVEEEDITLGIQGIFDAFEITFKKPQNQIIFKKITPKLISH